MAHRNDDLLFFHSGGGSYSRGRDVHADTARAWSALGGGARRAETGDESSATTDIAATVVCVC